MIEAARAAARITRAVQVDLALAGRVDKQDQSPVTVADFAGQAIVARLLAATFPRIPLVGEENSELLRQSGNESVRDSVVRQVKREWKEADAAAVLEAIDRGTAPCDGTGIFFTLDPVDGTKGFLRGAQYAVALALIENGRVEAAAMACPNLDGPEGASGTVFAAARERGAYSLPVDPGAGPEVPVRVSSLTDPATARFSESAEKAHSHQSRAARVAQMLEIRAEPVRIDSQCKYGLVARGDAEVYLRIPRGSEYVERIWDHAAGSLIVTEAGGTVTDIDGKLLDFGQGRGLSANRGVVASNGRLHAAVLEALAATETTDR